MGRIIGLQVHFSESPLPVEQEAPVQASPESTEAPAESSTVDAEEPEKVETKKARAKK